MKKIFVSAVCLFLCACSRSIFKEVALDEDFGSSTTISLAMVGDALIHSPIYTQVKIGDTYDFSGLFNDLDQILTKDLMYYNQETILGGKDLGYSGYPRFNTPDEFGLEMIRRGFNIVSLANNHTLDKGSKGIEHSVNFWREHKEVLTSGSYLSQKDRERENIYEKNGIKYTLLSYTILTNGLKPSANYEVDIYSDELVKKDVDRVRDKVDLLLVAMHWGNEYSKKPTNEQVRIAKYLASLKVDIVIGTHPHVIEPIEWIGDTLVIYSLGNFISNQTAIDNYSRKIGLLAKIDITKTSYQNRSKTYLSNLKTELLYMNTKNSDYRVIPFSKLDDSILKDYQSKKDYYTSIVQSLDESIIVE